MCDTMVAVQAGRVLFGKNSDRDANEGQGLEWHEARDHAEGSMLRCTYLEIPQVRRTYATLLSRPFWIWGAEIGANEHGVVIGNEAVFTREPYQSIGLTGMDLVRLGVERGATAALALAEIVRLLECFGQGGGCGLENRHFTYHNSFIIADPSGAIVLETAGRHWATEQIGPGQSRSISNGLSIPGFAEEFSDPLRTRVAGCGTRSRFTGSRVAAAGSPGDLMAILRGHDGPAGQPGYSRVRGGLGAPCVHGGGLIAASYTTASWVADLRPGGSLHWVTATAQPCTGLFKPVRVEDPVPIGPFPSNHVDGSLWWRHERMARRVQRNPESFLPLYRAERDAMESIWLREPPDSQAAFAENDRRLEDWTDRVTKNQAIDTRPGFVRRYWARRDRWAGL